MDFLNMKYYGWNKMAVSLPKSSVLLLHTLLLFNGCVIDASRLNPCKSGFFFEASEDRCKRCSECPVNQIISTPCTNVSDVKCESVTIPFFQSHYFEKDELSASVFYDIDLEEDSRLEERILSEQEDIYSKKLDNQANHGPAATVEKEDREYWKKLALALIGALSVLIVVATVVVVVAWSKVRRAATVKLPDDGDVDDTDSGYVVIRSIRHMGLSRSNTSPTAHCPLTADDDAHPPLLQSQSTCDSSRSASYCLQPPGDGPSSLCYLPKVYKPQRRLLNYDADDVFESDDNSGSLTRPRVRQSPTAQIGMAKGHGR